MVAFILIVTAIVTIAYWKGWDSVRNWLVPISIMIVFTYAAVIIWNSN